MDMSKIGGNVLKAFAVLAGILGGIGALYILGFVITVVLGSIFQTTVDGSLPITSGANTTLTSMETSFNTAVGSVTDGAEFATSLIPVAVILLVFGGVVAVGYVGYKKFKGGSNNQI